MNEIFYSICFPYCLRLPLLRNTLQSFRDQYAYRQDFEVSIAIDPKSKDEIPQLTNLALEYKEIPILLLTGEHQGISYLWNLSVEYSHGKYIVLQSPETLHACDVLSYFDGAFHLEPMSYQVIAVKNISATGEFISWYQHSVHHNRKLHFLSALNRENWPGMDTDFDAGVCYDDDMLLATIQHKGIKIICTDEVWGCHQNHPHLNWGSNRSMLSAKNKLLYRRKLAKLKKGN